MLSTDEVIRNFSNHYINPNSNLEIELRIATENDHNRGFVKGLFNNRKEMYESTKAILKSFSDPDLEYSVNFIEECNNKSLIKRNVYNNEQKTTSMNFKEPINHVYICYNDVYYKLAASIETPTTQELKEPNLARTKIRVSQSINDDFRFDVTITKKFDLKIKSSIDEIKNIIAKYYKLKLNELTNVNFESDGFDVEYEIEYVGMSKLQNAVGIKEAIDVATRKYKLNKGQSQNNEYKDLIVQASKLLQSNYEFTRRIIANPSIKSLLKQVLELDKSNFYNIVLPDISKYYVGHKYDGLRTLLWYRDSVLYVINKEVSTVQLNKIVHESFMLDAEFLDNKYYIFDVLMINNENLTGMPFSLRQSKIPEVVKNVDVFVAKIFQKCDKLKSYSEYYMGSEHENDGLIFNEDAGYFEMQVFKWKPADRMTIDFVIRKCPDTLINKYNFVPVDKRNTLYILFCGIDVNVMHKLKLVKMPQYNDIFPNTYQQNYIPIQFCPGNNPYAYLYESKDNALDNKIGEFLYNTVTKKWELHGIRTDRELDYSLGTYYGNNYFVAETTFNSILNPLQISEIDKPQKLGYFAESDNELYKSQRHYNSAVKEYLIKVITDDDYKNVVDLACGKGQDLFRYRRACVSFLLGIDSDLDALTEFTKRKFTFDKRNYKDREKDKVCNDSTGIYTLYADLNESYNEVLAAIKNNNIPYPAGGCDVVVCNLAFHYMCGSRDSIKNIIELVANLASLKSRFLFTCFDGAKVYELLKKHGGHYIARQNDVVKYEIKAKYKNVGFEEYGQQIDVLLPFSKGEYYTEYLVNIEYIRSVCKKYDFHLEICDHFMSYADRVSKALQTDLNDMDKEYIGLYTAVSFSRNAEADIRAENSKRGSGRKGRNL